MGFLEELQAILKVAEVSLPEYTGDLSEIFKEVMIPMLSEAKAEVKEIIQDYVLITYDIPASENKSRAAFLRAARAIGAMKYTESCYLLPYSDEALALANEVAVKGEIVVWRSHQPDEKKAIEITTSYGKEVEARCDYIDQRLAIAQEYMVAGKLAVAERMLQKTGRLLKRLAQINETYHPEWLLPRLQELFAKMKEMYG